MWVLYWTNCGLHIVKPIFVCWEIDFNLWPQVLLCNELTKYTELQISMVVWLVYWLELWKSLQLSRFKGILYRRGENSIRNWAKLSSLSCQSRSQNTCRKVAPAFWRPPLPWRCPVGTFTHRPRRLRRTPAAKSHSSWPESSLLLEGGAWGGGECC